MLPRQRGSGATQYQGPSTSPVPSSGLSRDHLATSLQFPQTGATAAPQGTPESPAQMIRSTIDRAWHIIVIVGPIVVIALALVAARRW